MENQEQTPIPLYTPPSPSITTDNNLAPQKKTNILLPMMLITIFSSVCFGLGGYYFGQQSSISEKAISENSPAPQATQSMNSTPTPVTSAETFILPSGWEYQQSQQKSNANECATLALPPISEPYVYTLDENRDPSVTEDKGSGRFWYFGGGSTPDLLTKVFLSSAEYPQTMALFATEIEASGYISQAVTVSCLPTNTIYTTNEGLIDSLRSNLETFNQSTEEKGMQASLYEIKSIIETKRWGQNVMDIEVLEDGVPVNYSMFVTPEYVYEVKIFGESTDPFVKETARTIFESMKI